MDWITSPEAWVAFGTLLALEIVLGVDNVIFISILAGKLPASQQAKARYLGLGLALVTRVLLLLSLSWMIRLTAPLFTVFGHEISGRDLILIIGGLFLIAKSTHEIHQKLEGAEGARRARGADVYRRDRADLLLDVVFSLDSVITAIGMVDHIGMTIAAVIGGVMVMIAFAGAIASFVERHPTVKMLALSFLLLIGVTLMAEGFDQHISKGYIYSGPMAFSVFVEMLNLRVGRAPVGAGQAA